MERRLENIPQKPGSPDKKRKFDVLQHSTKKEDAKLKDSTPNIAHHSGEASGSSRPDESVKKQKTLLNDSIGEFNKMIEYYKNEQHQLYNKIKENRQRIEEIEDEHPSIEPFILEYQWQIDIAKSENSEKRAENKFIKACSDKGDNIKAAANKVIKLVNEINQYSQYLAKSLDRSFSIEEQIEIFQHATHGQADPNGPQTSFGQVQPEHTTPPPLHEAHHQAGPSHPVTRDSLTSPAQVQRRHATLPPRHEVHHQAAPSDQADIPQDRQKQIEMLVADLVKHSGNGFRKNPIRIYMSKHKMNQEEYNSSFKYLYENFKGSGLRRIDFSLYGTYSDRTVERKR